MSGSFPTPVPPNRCLIGVHQDAIILGLPPAGRMTPRDAAEFAAWLSVMAESIDPSVDFPAIRKAVESS